jgi:PAS domain S-box-containing protein
LELPGVSPATVATLDQALSFVPSPYDGQLRATLESLSRGTDEEVVLDYPVELPSSDVVWVETRARSVRSATGQVVLVRGTTQDISARKAAELAQRGSEDRLHQAQRLAGIGSFEIDFRSDRFTGSPELYRLFDTSPETIGDDVAEIHRRMPPSDAQAVRAHLEEMLVDGRPRQFEHRYLRGEETRWAETRIEPLPESDDPYGSRGTMQDITDRKRAESEIHLQARLLDAVHAAVIATDLEGSVTHWNRGAERMYGWTREETVNRSITELTVGPEDETTAAAMAAVSEESEWEGEFEVRRKDGSRFPAHVRNALITDSDGQPTGVVGVSVDIGDRVETERQLRSSRDYLHAVSDSMGEGLFTLDTEGRLVYVNHAGEQLLGWRQEELAGQVMHDITHYRRTDGTPMPADECPLAQVRLTGEVVRVEDDIFMRKDGSELPVEMTAAPFESEDGVNGTVVVFSDITARKTDELEVKRQMESLSWVGRIRDALTDERFVLYAQPIIDVVTGETVQHELLIRLIDRGGTVIAPAEFLPAAERYGLILDIDRWVIGQALELAGQGHPVELNLSAHSIAAGGALDAFRKELERTSADPSLVVIELTETALVGDENAAELFVERVKAMGFSLALDDFGTGYGGFNYLKRLEIDFLKIDIEFVRDLATNQASQHVVRAVVSLAEGFGQKTVAEGVEDDETLSMLRDFGVDYAQGYAIARPMPVAEVLNLTNERRSDARQHAAR